MQHLHKKIIFRLVIIVLAISVFSAGFSFEIICPLEMNKCKSEAVKRCCEKSNASEKSENESDCSCEMRTKKVPDKINKNFISNLPVQSYEQGTIQITINIPDNNIKEYNLNSEEIILDENLYLTNLNLRI